MKPIVLLIILFLFSNVSFSKDKDEVKKNDETYRAQFHFSPEMNKMGRPLSVWQNDSTYHLYFQYNPYNLLEGYINWGLASSKNLLNWEQKEIVISQPESISDSMEQVPWAGSVCADNDGAMAWINRWNDGVYQSKSADGVNWSDEVKTSGIDFLTESESDVFWYEATQKWVMIAFDRKTTTMHILNSADGLHWKETSKFNYTFGFPQLFELPVDRKADDTRWVLASEKGTYIIGTFNGEEFELETSVRKFNHSQKIGSSVFFRNFGNDKIYGISLLEGKQLADLPSSGQLSFPVEVSLHQFESGIEMIQQPIAALEDLYSKMYSWEAKKIYPGLDNNLLKKVKGTEIQIKGSIELINCDQFGFVIRSDRESQGTEITYSVKNSEINFLGTRLDYKPVNNKMEIEILIDRSSIELFVDGGRYVMSYPFSPKPESLKYELFTMGGEIMVHSLEVHQLKSIWREE